MRTSTIMVVFVVGYPKEAGYQEALDENRLAMGCNGWNHHPDCDCGWGGDNGYLHVSHGGGLNLHSEKMLTVSSLLNPNAKCPVCGDPVYYYESPYGGRVFFDEIGPPWAKHPCTDNGSPSVSSFEGVLNFMEAKMTPEKAMQLAAELVRYAMTDFREPNRKWPGDGLSGARHEVLDWLFRRHSTGEEHLVPLSDLILIISFIEERARSTIKGSDAGECRILRLRPVTTNNAHETRALCPLGLSQTCVCETMPKPIRTGEFSFHSPCRNEKLTKGHARHAMKQPKRRILHRPASDPILPLPCDRLKVLDPKCQTISVVYFAYFSKVILGNTLYIDFIR